MPAPTFRFGEFELDRDARALRRRGEELTLPGKVFACIVVLVENRHRAVGRDELMTSVWGHAHLTESVLGQVIRQARQLLCDNGDEQSVIRTLRGFGYRWIAPVACDAESTVDMCVSDATTRTEPLSRTQPQAPSIDARARESATTSQVTTASRRRAPMSWLLTAVLVALAALIPPVAMRRVPPHAAADDSLALMLPIAGPSDPADAWMRLGLMDFVARRLRNAGQRTVPTDTVLALLHGEDGDGAALRRALADSTHARFLVEGRAERSGAGWRVTLRSDGDGAPLDVAGEGADVLDAARVAADRLAISLGVAPAAGTDGALGGGVLEQRINAAMLAQKTDIARQLIDDAPAETRRLPAIRMQQGRIAFYDHDLGKARSIFEALLADPAAGEDAPLRARALNGLAVARIAQGDRAGAEAMLEEAVRTFGDDAPAGTLDSLGIIWMNLGNFAQERGDLELARGRMAHARRVFESIGDARGLAQLDTNVGVLETRRDHYVEAAARFESAAARHASIRNADAELAALANLVESRLILLDDAAAASVQPRIGELLERAGNPDVRTHAAMVLVDLYDAIGQDVAARARLEEAERAVEVHPDMLINHTDVTLARAERALREDDANAAVRDARSLVDALCSDPATTQQDACSRAGLVLVRARIARGELAAAADDDDAMLAWANRRPESGPRILATLADAELAVARRREDDARAAFDRALALADESRVPASVLRVVESYVGWLLAQPAEAGVDADRILRIADHVTDYATRDYGAALVRLRVYRALGPRAAWEAALAGARSLAGDRRLPADLVSLP